MMALSDYIIEAFRALGGSRSIGEIEDWVTRRHGGRWASSSFSTAMADMVPESLGGNRSSLVPVEKRVLRRVSRGVYGLVSDVEKPDSRLKPATESVDEASSLDVFVVGTPAPFANRGEGKWKDRLRGQVPRVDGSGNERGLVLRFGYTGGGDLDNLCDPVFSVVVNEKGWFGGRRNNMVWWQASKGPGLAGCYVKTSANVSPEPLSGEEVFSGVYRGAIPRRAVDEPMIGWVRSSYDGGYVGAGAGVELYFRGWCVNLGDVATGPVKSCIDCLQPVIGGPVGNPDDWKIGRLQVVREGGEHRELRVRVTV
jgi:hypothetical protein